MNCAPQIVSTGKYAREMMINAYASRERPRGWPFLAHHWELIIVSLEGFELQVSVRSE